MATYVLGAIGSAIGGPIGGMVGAMLGGLTDRMALSALTPGTKTNTTNVGPRLTEMSLTNSQEGATIARVVGRARIGGQVIWATQFKEVAETTTTTQTQGGKGGGPTQTTTTVTTVYKYYLSFAVAFCEGNPRAQLGRVWIDSDETDLSKFTFRWYPGSQTQSPDPLIQAKEGAGKTPAFRGTAYIVFEDLPLEEYGNRMPQITAEVVVPLDSSDPDDLQNLGRSFTMIPAAGETVYGTQQYTNQDIYYNPYWYFLPQVTGAKVDNVHNNFRQPDAVLAVNQLNQSQQNLEAVSLVVSWFGNDLRADQCAIVPKIEDASRHLVPNEWAVSTYTRGTASLVSRDAQNRPFFGGTPSDATVLEMVAYLQALGKRVVFYPFVMMDIPPSNTLPNPYSNNAATNGQPAFPWRGRITCSPAAGYTGSPDKTAAAGTQINTFFTRTQGYRAMVLHYANLLAGRGLDAFIIGSELVGLTQVRSAAGTYPGVTALATLAADVKALLGGSVKVGYAADWSEYHSHRPTDGSNDVYFNMDPLWSSSGIDFIGIDNYLPCGDWRDGTTHLDYNAATGPVSEYDPSYIKANIEGGEYYDWYYASSSARSSQTRTPILDFSRNSIATYVNSLGAITLANPNIPRYGYDPITLAYLGLIIEGASTNLIVNSEMANGLRPPLSGGLTTYLASGFVGLLNSRGVSFGYDGVTTSWAYGQPTPPSVGNYVLSVFVRMSDSSRPTVSGTDGTASICDFGLVMNGALIIPNSVTVENWHSGLYRVWATLSCPATTGNYGIVKYSTNSSKTFSASGYQLEAGTTPTSYIPTAASTVTRVADSTGAAPWVFRQKDIRNWWLNAHKDRPNGVESASATAWTAQSKPIWFTEFGCPAINKGTNQPNVFYDPKSSESFFPYFSTGQRDDFIQRLYLECTLQYWRDNAPTSGVYGDKMVKINNMFIWTWDARPFPNYPMRSDVWSDGALWVYGHWLSGRIDGAVLPRLVASICERVGLTSSQYDVSGLYGPGGLVRGLYIGNVSSERDVLEMLARFHMFQGYESEGKLKFTMNLNAKTVTIPADKMVLKDDRKYAVSVTRKQETDLPRAMKLSFLDETNSYQAATVDGQKATGSAQNVISYSFPIVSNVEYVRALGTMMIHQAWRAREVGDLVLPPSYSLVEQGDGIYVPVSATRSIGARVDQVDITKDRAIEFTGFDTTLFAPPSISSDSRLPIVSQVFQSAIVEFMDLPLVTDTEELPHAPRLAVHARPWPGSVNILKSDGAGGFNLIQTLYSRTTMGVLNSALYSGPTDRWDDGNVFDVQVYQGELATLSKEQLLASNANAMAVYNANGLWEVLQFASAALVSTGVYRLSKLLRGQLDTADAMAGAPYPAGSRFVILEPGVVRALNVSKEQAPLHIDYRWGPSTYPSNDPTYITGNRWGTKRGLRPYAPCDARLVRSSATGDLTISWKRRTRTGGDGWEQTEVPLNEEAEQYQLVILSGPGGTVKRTVVLTSPTFAYTSANQVTDFGSNQTQVYAKISQYGAEYGNYGGVLEGYIYMGSST